MTLIKDLDVGVWFRTLAGNLYQLVEKPDGDCTNHKIKSRNGEARLVRGEVRVRSEIPGTGEPTLVEDLDCGTWFSWKGCVYRLVGDDRNGHTGEVYRFSLRTPEGRTETLAPGTEVEVVHGQPHEFPCNCGAIFTKYDAYLAHAATFDCKSGSPDGVLSEGVKHDGDKPMMGLLPWGPLREVAKVLTFGARKYAPNNWKKVTPPSRYFDAALRHLAAYEEGEDDDEESGLSHLAHAASCLLIALWHQGKGRPARHSEED